LATETRAGHDILMRAGRGAGRAASPADEPARGGARARRGRVPHEAAARPGRSPARTAALRGENGGHKPVRRGRQDRESTESRPGCGGRRSPAAGAHRVARVGMSRTHRAWGWRRPGRSDVVTVDASFPRRRHDRGDRSVPPGRRWIRDGLPVSPPAPRAVGTKMRGVRAAHGGRQARTGRDSRRGGTTTADARVGATTSLVPGQHERHGIRSRCHSVGVGLGPARSVSAVGL